MRAKENQLNTGEIELLFEKYHLMLYRLSFVLLKNVADTEDAVQETLLRVLEKQPRFDNEDHERAWLIVTCRNICKDKLRHWWRRNKNLDDYEYTLAAPEEKQDELLPLLLSLQTRFKEVLYLYYYEGWSTKDIADLLGKRPGTVRNLLVEGRRKLKEVWEIENEE